MNGEKFHFNIGQTPQVHSSLFARFFELYPELKSYFNFHECTTWEEMCEDKYMRAHSLHVIYSMTMIVDNINDTEVMVEMIKMNIKNHIRRRITPEHYEKMKRALLETLVELLGTTVMDAATVQAWTKGYDFVLEMVKDAHNMFYS